MTATGAAQPSPLPLPRETPPPAPSLLRLSWPIFAEQSLHMLTGVVDTLMVSRISDQAVAALGSAWQIIVLFMMTFNVLAVGASIVTTHHLGAGDMAGARRLARGAVATNLWLGALVSVGLTLAAPTLLGWAQLSPALMAYALPFLQWMGATLFLESMNFALSAVLRAQGHTREVMLVMLAQNVLNALTAAVLIFGLFGAPELGVTGVAMGTALSRLLACVALWLLANHHMGLQLRPRDLLSVPKADLQRLLSFGFPAVLENISWFGAFILITALTARMGDEVLATQTYAMQLAGVTMLLSVAIGLGNEILIGRLVGAGRIEDAYAQCLRHMKMALVLTGIVAAAMALASPLLLRVFTQDAQIIQLGVLLAVLGLVLEPGRSFNLIMINALRASGDTRFPVALGLLSQWGVMALGAWWLGTWWGLGLLGVWAAFICDEWLRGLLMLWRWRSRRWVRHAHLAQAAAADAHAAVPGNNASAVTAHP